MSRTERHLVAGLGAAFIFGLCIATSFISALHDPSPYQLPVAIVAPSSVVHQVGAGLAAHAPGAFEFRTYSSTSAAVAAIESRNVDGAFIVSGGGNQLLVADAGGLGPSQALTQAFTAMSTAMGQHLTVRDVAPLPAGNREGLSIFLLILSVLVPSLIAGAVSSLVARGILAPVQLGALTVFAVLLGAGVVGIADGLGALTTHYLVLAAVAALFSLSVSAPTAALARIHPAGAALASIFFFILGIPASGGPVGLAQFVPGLFRFFNPVLPASVALPSLTNVEYFAGHDVGQDLLVLGVWAAAGAVLLLTLGQVGSKRSQVPVPAEVAGAR